ncbi:hypothetical protein [Chromohalobacter canadensis]|nr:hypothetical protein [Chromohalobacter canadensis]
MWPDSKYAARRPGVVATDGKMIDDFLFINTSRSANRVMALVEA